MFIKRATLIIDKIAEAVYPVVYSPHKTIVVTGQPDWTIKHAELEIDGDNTEFNLKAEISDHPDSLYIKCFAIKADETNDNGDYFSYVELKKATSTFVGVPVFTNHQNNDVEKARGKVVHSWWDEDKNGIMIIARVDAEAYPQLARLIKEDIVAGTSMGASRGHDLVSMADGSKKRVDELQVNDSVFTHSGKIEPVAAICQTQEHSKLYHIRWSGNMSGLSLSFEHPVLVLKREDLYYKTSIGKIYRKTPKRIRKEAKPEFTPASEIKAGDYVLEWIDHSIKQDEISDDVAFLLGVYAAEGYTSSKDKYVQFCFGLEDVNANKAKEILSSPGFRFPGRVTDSLKPEKNGRYITIYNSKFTALCNEYVRSGSHNKKLNNTLKRWPLRLQKIFLGAYIDGDGCKVKERTDKNGYSSGKGALQISSASIQLLKDVRHLCLRLGVPATLSTHERVATKSTVMDRNTKYIEHILYITNTITEKISKYSYKAQTNTTAERPKFDSFFYEDYIAHRVKDVPVMDNCEPTYYVQIGELEDENSDHSYILNDIATHNCQVAHSICSICHNYAEMPDQYCACIRERKTRHVSSRSQKCSYHENGPDSDCPFCGCKKGEKKKYKVDMNAFEYNYGIKFIENSFVVSPACHDCGVTEIIDPTVFLAKVASIRLIMPQLSKAFDKINVGTRKVKVAHSLLETMRNFHKIATDLQETLPPLLKAASERDIVCTDKSCVKLAGQKELQDLTQALDLASSVSKSMLEQRQQIDLEFLSDLVSILAELQTLVDELTQQGYGSLPSPGEAAPAPTQDNAAPLGAAAPMNPTPGGGSKIQSGSAGEAGTVTSPTAAKHLDMTKLTQNVLKRKHLTLPPALKLENAAQTKTIDTTQNKKSLDLKLKLAHKNMEKTIDDILESARQELNDCIESSAQSPNLISTQLLKIKTLLDRMN